MKRFWKWMEDTYISYYTILMKSDLFIQGKNIPKQMLIGYMIEYIVEISDETAYYLEDLDLFIGSTKDRYEMLENIINEFEDYN